MPKKHAPRPSSTAVSRIRRLAIAASMCQNGTGQRASSWSVQPLSASAYRWRYAALLEHGMSTTGAVAMPRSQLSGSSPGVVVTSQKRSRSARSSSTRNAQPWLKPALGARTALASARSTTAGSTGVSAYSRIIRRRRTTSWNSMEPSVPDHFERMWADLLPVGRSAASGGYFRQPFGTPERELAAWFVEQALARSLRLAPHPFGNLGAWWDVSVVPDGSAGAPSMSGPERRGPSLPGVVTGSHLDSVLDGGAYDGPLGVVSALAAVDLLRERGFRPSRPIGVSVFVEEEGSRFGLACLGSRLATGATSWSHARGLRDRHGVRLDEVMAQAGLGAEDPEPWLDSSRIACFVELHVEQGRDL